MLDITIPDGRPSLHDRRQNFLIKMRIFVIMTTLDSDRVGRHCYIRPP